MNIEALPQLRLEIEHLKYTILAQLGLRGSELGECLSKEVDKAINSYPWERKVQEVTHAAITSHIEHYFKYGNGSRAIKSAVEEGFRNVTKIVSDDLSTEKEGDGE